MNKYSVTRTQRDAAEQKEPTRQAADAMMETLREFFREHLADPESGWSIGTVGAIAEFQRVAGDKALLREIERPEVATERGALRLCAVEHIWPIAYESLSQHGDGWVHGVAFCLTDARAQMSMRTALTEIGPDMGAVSQPQRAATLFDLGLGIPHVDACIRTADPELARTLRARCGRSLLEPGNFAMAEIRDRSPHRVFLSRLGRIEVYQLIPASHMATPEGPHTHVLPKLLGSQRTHSDNTPLPEGLLPCLKLYPPHPLIDGHGNNKPFNRDQYHRFQALLDAWGDPQYRQEKARAALAVQSDIEPGDYRPPKSRVGRAALRITLRQLAQLAGDKALLERWRKRFDAGQELDSESSEH